MNIIYKWKIFIFLVCCGVTMHAQHMGEPYGFASVSAYGVEKLTGGAGGEVVVINGQSDAKKLQDALDDDNEPRIIYIIGQVQLPEYTNELESPVSDLSTRMTKVKSNKTILGVGKDAAIVNSGLSIYSGSGEGVDYEAETTVKNVIIQNLTFTGGLDDEINIQGGSHHIWIDHCYFESGSDGLLDYKRGSDYVTVSYCHFYDHGKMSLVGHSPDVRDIDMGHLRITYDHCFWDDRGERSSRHPRIRHGIVHQVNCYFLGESPDRGIDGIVCNEDGRLLVEGCYFENPKWATQVAYGDDIAGQVKEKNNTIVGCKDLDKGEEIWFGRIEWDADFNDLTSEFPNYPSANPYDYYSLIADSADTAKVSVLAEVGGAGATLNLQMGDYVLDIAIVGGGKVAVEPDKSMYLSGDTVKLIAIPNNYYQFEQWNNDGTGTDSIITVIMDSDKDIEAVFYTDMCKLTVAVFDFGNVTISPQKEMYDVGDVVTLTAVPDDYCAFEGWSGDVSSTESEIVITMIADKAIEASFSSLKRYLDISFNDLGSISIEPQKEFYLDGDEVTLNVNANENCEFVGWSGDLSGVNTSETIEFDGSDITISALFMRSPSASIEIQAYDACDYNANNNEPFYTNHSGYTGDGFVDLENETGSYIVWSVDASEIQSVTLTFRYSNGGSSVRAMSLKVNGSVVETLTFGETTDWDTWNELSATVTLTHGTNQIELIATNSDGGPNFDKVSIDATSIAQGECNSTDIPESYRGEINSTVYPNPVNDILNIDLTVEQKSQVTIIVFNAAGGLCDEHNCILTKFGLQTLQLDVSKYTPGIYIVVINVEGEKFYSKIVKY